MQTELFLVRHGESISNVEGRFSATPPGPGLTERGRMQAQAACRRILQDVRRPHRIVSSPMRRALETAQPLCLETGLGPELCTALTETAFGAWDGRLAAELRGLSQYDGWCTDPERFPPPGGESLSQVGFRVGNCLRGIAEECPGQTLVAFTHMHPLVSFLQHAAGQPYGRVSWLPNAAVVRARWNGQEFEFVGLDLQAAHAGSEEGYAYGG